MLCDYIYELKPLATKEDFSEFIQKKSFKAINVTIPYKQDVIPYLDEISDKARSIGSVNTIVNRNGKLCGDNTDFDGFLYMVRRTGYNLTGKKALILGTGGTQKTVYAALQSAGISKVVCVSRNPSADEISYENIKSQEDVQVIVNTTPVGMYPDCGISPVDLSSFSSLEAVFDVVYNPFETKLLFDAKQKGCITSNGLAMLVAQAKYAAEIFISKKIKEEKIEEIIKKLYKDIINIVLIGMPGCGKTTFGKYLANEFNKNFVDIDEQIEKETNKTIPKIFADEGEVAFRIIESFLTAKVCAQSRQVIATGGGVVTREENILPLRQNSLVIYLERDINNLQIGGKRPLSKDRAALKKMYELRDPLYKKAAHFSINVDGDLTSAEECLKEKIYEVFDS